MWKLPSEIHQKSNRILSKMPISFVLWNKVCQFGWRSPLKFWRHDFCQIVLFWEKTTKKNHFSFTSYDLTKVWFSEECELIKKHGNPSNDTVRFLLRFLLKLRFKDVESCPSIVDFVPGINQMRSFR